MTKDSCPSIDITPAAIVNERTDDREARLVANLIDLIFWDLDHGVEALPS